MQQNKTHSLPIYHLCSGLIFLIVLSLCGTVFAQQNEPIVIGEVTDFTGPSSATTPLMNAAMDLAIAEYDGTINGRPIKVIREDGGTDPVLSVDKAKKLVERDKASIMIGPIAAVAAIPVNFYLQRSGLPHICMEMPIGVHKKGGNLFSAGGTQRFGGYIMGKYASEVLGHKTATVIHDDVIFAEEFLQGAMDGFVSGGGTIIQRQRTPMNAMEYGPYLSTMKKADVCLFWFVPPHAMRFVTQYREYGLKMPLMVSGISILGKPLINQLADKALGIYAMSAFEPDADLPAVKQWLTRWKARYGNQKALSEPGFAEVCSWYVQAKLALEALKATEGNTSPAKLKKAIHKIKLQTPWGELSFNESGLSIGNVFITQVVSEDGGYKYKTVKTYKQVLKAQPSDTKDVAPKM